MKKKKIPTDKMFFSIYDVIITNRYFSILKLKCKKDNHLIEFMMNEY